MLKPSVERLAALMAAAIEDAPWRTAGAAAGPLHVAADYTREPVVERLPRAIVL